MDAASGALNGLKVVDLSRVLGGPFCTQVLGDHGADVIKVEPPAGDDTRGWGPPFKDGAASYFLGTNRNKRSIVLDLAKPAERVVLLALLEDADVLIENFKTGTMEKWGLGPEELAEKFPRLIYCRVTGFGADGPLGGLPGYDAAAQAIGGLMAVNGERGGGPLRIGVPVVDLVAGLNAGFGILAALLARGRTGRGQFVESALYDTAISLLHPQAANYFVSGREGARAGNAHPNIAPYSLFKTGGAPIFLAVGNDGQFRKLCEYLKTPEISADPRFGSNADRVRNLDALQIMLEAALTSHDGATLAEPLARAGVPCGPVLGLAEALAHPHAAHRGMVVDVEDYRGLGSPIKMSETPATYRRKPPKLDEHGADIRREIAAKTN